MRLGGRTAPTAADTQRGRFLQGRSPIRDRGKTLAAARRLLPRERTCSNGVRRTWSGRLLRRFCTSGVAALIVDRPLQEATALRGYADVTACRGAAACASGRSSEAWKSAERHFRGEFRPRVLVARRTPGASSRVPDVARISHYSPRPRQNWKRKSISGAQRGG